MLMVAWLRHYDSEAARASMQSHIAWLNEIGNITLSSSSIRGFELKAA